MKLIKNGFTLSEVLITLSIVGILAMLVLPGLIKETTNKAMIALLQSTVKNLDDAIQNELVKTRVSDIKDSDIYKEPKKFFANLDYVKYEDDNTCFQKSDGTDVKYKALKNATPLSLTEMDASVLLKNGVVIGFARGEDTEKISYYHIDTNGPKEPNIAGIDYFILALQHQTNPETGDHIGDIGCGVLNDEDTDLEDCKTSDMTTCYCALENSGFDPKYLEQ